MLKLSKEVEEKVIEFDEVMGCSGLWETSYTSSSEFVNSCMELDYKSDDYKYYICEEPDGEHYLYRSER